MTPDHPRYKWWMVLTVVPAGLISAIDGTSVGIAIPSMMTSLRADLDQIQWVVTTYLLMQTLLMPMTGWLTALLTLSSPSQAHPEYAGSIPNYGTITCTTCRIPCTTYSWKWAHGCDVR